MGGAVHNRRLLPLKIAQQMPFPLASTILQNFIKIAFLQRTDEKERKSDNRFSPPQLTISCPSHCFSPPLIYKQKKGFASKRKRLNSPSLFLDLSQVRTEKSSVELLDSSAKCLGNGLVNKRTGS